MRPFLPALVFLATAGPPSARPVRRLQQPGNPGQVPSQNGASDLLVKVFGDRGKHARPAVGMYALPFNITTEIEMIVEVDP